MWQGLQNFDSGSSALRLSQRARRIARLLSYRAANHSHNLIEGGDLSWRNLRLRPSRKLREGTDKSFLNGAELTLRKCKAGFRMSDLKEPKVLARVSNGQREALYETGRAQ